MTSPTSVRELRDVALDNVSFRIDLSSPVKGRDRDGGGGEDRGGATKAAGRDRGARKGASVDASAPPEPSGPWTVTLSSGALVIALVASAFFMGGSYRLGAGVAASMSASASLASAVRRLASGGDGRRLASSSLRKLLPLTQEGNAVRYEKLGLTAELERYRAREKAEVYHEEEVDEDSSDDEDDEEDSSDDEEDEDDGSIPSLEYNLPGSGQTLVMDVDGVSVDWANLLIPGAGNDNDHMTKLGHRITGRLQVALAKSNGDSEAGWQALSHHCHSMGGGRALHCAMAMWERSHLLLQLFTPSATASSSDSKGEGEGDVNDDGAVRLILFTSTHGTSALLDLVPRLKRIFVTPTGDENVGSVMDTHVRWGFQHRGFFFFNKFQGGGKDGDAGGARDPYVEDLGEFFLQPMRVHTKKIISADSIFQRIDIYDVLNPKHVDSESHRRSLLPAPNAEVPSYESLHPQFFAPNRYVFLDGVIQSTYRGDAPYHEALVHPAMFLHPHPRRVAIIGGGEGATLREVLKHDTVEHVKMIDIDEVMVKVSDEFLPEWNDCSEIEGSHESCFEDPRADVLYEDAMAWFINRFGPPSMEEGNEGSNDLHGTEEKFDVIIMDALDPQDTVEFANVLYNSDILVKSLRDGLTDDGVLVMQLGMAIMKEDPPEEMQRHSNRAVITKRIAELGFESMHTFEESHCGFNEPWTFFAACKARACRGRFYRNEAQVERDIHGRIRRRRRQSGSEAGSTTSETSSELLLRYFDGATMKSYWMPHRAVELAHCRSNPVPVECEHGTGYRTDRALFRYPDHLEVRTDEDGASTGVYAKVDIPKMSYIQTGVGVAAIRVPAMAAGRIFGHSSSVPSPLVDFVREFGLKSSLRGESEWHIDAGVYPLINHGCNGTSNIGHLASWMTRRTKLDESYAANAMASSPLRRRLAIETPEGVEGHQHFSALSPVLDRRISSFEMGYLMALRDIRRGEEVTTNHLHWGGDDGPGVG